MVTNDWLVRFPQARLVNLTAPTSDHSPILLTCVAETSSSGPQQFRFENAWLLNSDIERVVRTGWMDAESEHIMQRITTFGNAI